MEVFLIDSWDGNKQDNKLIFSSNLLPYQGNLFHLSNFPRLSVNMSGEIVPLEKTFTDRLSNQFNYKFI